MIKLRIQTANGTKIELDIPIDDSAKIQPDAPASAVPILEDTHGASESGKLLDCEQHHKLDDDASFDSSDDIMIRSGDGEGEVGEGVEGGVGEEEGEAGEGRKGRTCRVTPKLYSDEVAQQRFQGLQDFVFETRSGEDWTVPHKYLDNLLLLHPIEKIRSQFVIARGWLLADPRRRKTFGGMTRFINNWFSNLESPPGWKQQQDSPKPVHGSLLKNGNEHSEGW